MAVRLRAAFIIAAVLIGPGIALGATTVIGNGLASECSREAISGRFDKPTLDLCNAALDGELMRREDTAKTYVNRGVVHLRRNSYELADKDFSSAERIWPKLAELYINRGAVRIRQRRYQEAVAEIDKGLALNPSEPEKAYFNRGLAKEQLDDVKGAYLDFMKAVELKPDWQDPKIQLLRYTVEQR